MVHINTKNERIFTQSMDTPRRNPKPVDVWLINAMNSILNTDKFSNMIRITVGDLRSRTGNADKRRRNTAFAIPISRNRYGNYPVVSFLIHSYMLLQKHTDCKLIHLQISMHP